MGTYGPVKTPVYLNKCCWYHTTFFTGPDPVFLWCKILMHLLSHCNTSSTEMFVLLLMSILPPGFLGFKFVD